MMGDRDTLLVLSRGPLLIIAVLIPYIIPYICRINLDQALETTAKIFIVLFGVAVFVQDLSVIATKRIRRYVNDRSNNIVVDDCLQALFDPNIGFIPTFWNSWMGGIAMYALPTTHEQRTQLMQHALAMNSRQAERMLHHPGGVKTLLPEKVQQWLETEDIDDVKVSIEPVASIELDQTHVREQEADNLNKVTSMDSDSSTSSAELLEESHEDKARPPVSHVVTTASFPSPRSYVASPTSSRTNVIDDNLNTAAKAAATSWEDVPSPLVVFSSIIVDAVRRCMAEQLDRIDDVWVQRTCASAAVALALQMGLSRRARQVAWTGLQATVTTGLLAALLGSVSIQVAKHGNSSKLWWEQPKKELENAAVVLYQSAFQTVCKPLATFRMPLSFAQHVASAVRASNMKRKLQGVATALVFAYFARRHRRGANLERSPLRRPRKGRLIASRG